MHPALYKQSYWSHKHQPLLQIFGKKHLWFVKQEGLTPVHVHRTGMGNAKIILMFTKLRASGSNFTSESSKVRAIGTHLYCYNSVSNVINLLEE